MGLKIGANVPDFSLKDQNGNLFQVSEQLGKKPLVIFFYPKNFTPGCVKEVCSFRDNYEQFTEFGAEVIGISSDSEKSHRNFVSRYNLPFVLLADTHKKVRRLFKVENNLLVLPGRETYVIDKQGKIRMVFNSMSASLHIRKALKILKENVEL